MFYGSSLNSILDYHAICVGNYVKSGTHVRTKNTYMSRFVQFIYLIQINKLVASENMCKAAVSIIVGWRVSPAVLHQFVSHSVPLSPLLFPFFSVSPCSRFSIPTPPPCPSPKYTRIHRHTQTLTPTHTLVSIMNLSCGWLCKSLRRALPDPHTSAFITLHQEREKGRRQRGETGVAGRQKECR